MKTKGRYTFVKELTSNVNLNRSLWLVRCSCGREYQKNWNQIKATCDKECRCVQMERAEKIKAWLLKNHDVYTTAEAAEHWGIGKPSIAGHCRKLGIKMMQAPPQEVLSIKRKRERSIARALRARMPAFMGVFNGTPTN